MYNAVLNLSNYRVVNVFVINSSGKIWIPRRHSNKAHFPLAFDMSIGGHVESGETYEAALITHLTHGLINKPCFLTPASRSDLPEQLIYI